MARKKVSAGQRRAAKLAARRRRGGGESRPAPVLRPILTLPGLDGYDPADLDADETRTDGLPELRLALAQTRAETELGYRIPPVADPDAYPQAQLVEWTTAVARHHRAIVDADPGEHACVAELVDHRVRTAVAATRASASPGTAREEVGVLAACDGAYPGRALSAAEDALHTRLAAVDDLGPARAWVAATLGPEAGRLVATVGPGAVSGHASGGADRDGADRDGVGPGAGAPPAGVDRVVALLWLAAGADATA